MDFHLSERAKAFEAEVIEFLDKHWDGSGVQRAHETGTYHDWDFHHALGEAGYLGASWPKEYGGQDRDPFEMAMFHSNLAKRRIPVDGMATTLMVSGVIRIAGTDEQRAKVIPAALRGEILIALGYSEPESGSDAAAAATRAVRDGDEWVINGQKMFTTLAQEAHYVFMLCRTNTEVPKHKGLTMFLVPMDTPGIEIQPVHTLGGERTNITFYDDVRISDSWRVGDVDNGWRVMSVALQFERGGSLGSELERNIGTAIAWARSTVDENGNNPIDDPMVRSTLAQAEMRMEVSRLFGLKTIWGSMQSGMPGSVDGSMGKLYSSENLVRTASELVDLFGADGQLQHGAEGAPTDGWVEHLYRHAQVTTIYGGTSEIQRSIIAEKGLGLPRTR